MSLIDQNYFNGKEVFLRGGFGQWTINRARALVSEINVQIHPRCPVSSNLGMRGKENGETEISSILCFMAFYCFLIR